MFNCCAIFDNESLRKTEIEKSSINDKNITDIYKPIFEHNAQYCETCWDFKEKCKCYNKN